jgi:general nucleoside transport system permease protein
MSMTTVAPEELVAVAPETDTYWTRARKAGVTYMVLGVLAVVFWGVFAQKSGDSRFTLGETVSGASLPLPSKPFAITFAAVAVLSGAALMNARLAKRFALWSSLAVIGLTLSFLCWQLVGNTLPLGDTAQGTVFYAVPLMLGALAGVLGERSGVINIAIEGQFLMGAFLAALFGTVAASAWIGLLGGILGGVLVAALLAVLAIRFLVDQVVLGVVLNLLALGLTSFLYGQLMQRDSESFNSSPPLPSWTLPGLSKIPIIGPAIFEQNVIVYIAIFSLLAMHFGLFHTKWGLRTRAVGEHPKAADTVGIKVLALRYRNVLIAGVIAGIGGAFFTIGSDVNFTKNMTVGKGFIALAALIFGRWSPTGAALAALLFGFTLKLGEVLSAVGTSIPAEFVAMLPYAVTILAVAGFVGRVKAPAADGKPYIKG